MQIGTINTSRYNPYVNVREKVEMDGYSSVFSTGAVNLGKDIGIEKSTPPTVSVDFKSATAEQKEYLQEKYDIKNIRFGSDEHKKLMSELRDMNLISDKDYAGSDKSTMRYEPAKNHEIRYIGPGRYGFEKRSSALSGEGGLWEYYSEGSLQHKSNFIEYSSKPGSDCANSVKRAYEEQEDAYIKGNISDRLYDIFYT